MEISAIKRKKINIFLFLIGIFIISIICSIATKFNFLEGLSSIPGALIWLLSEFIPDIKSLSKLPEILNKLLETILLSIAATTVGGIFALFFGIMGAKVTRINGLFSTISRFEIGRAHV